MSTNIKIFLLCPVPEDQKPMNEYIGLKENLLTRWTTFSTSNYEKRIFFLFSTFFFFISLIQFSHFQGIYYGFEWVLENLWWSTLCLLFFFLIVLSRWLQIENRFNQARLFYEEASWYDGQIWEKPLGIIKNDKFIHNQKIQPILQRIQKTLLQVISLNFLCLFLLQLS
jgi:hypothetical protein